MDFGKPGFFGISHGLYGHRKEMSNKRDISVVIPVLNGASQLPRLVQSIREQRECVIREIIVIDSVSDDGIFDVSKKLDLVFISIPDRKRFDHGGTRTIAARRAGGDFILFLTQDVELKDKTVISKLLSPMLENDKIAASYGRQLPYPDANFLSRSIRAFNYPPPDRVEQCGEKRRVRCAFLSNNFCLYRREAMEPFGWFGEHQICSEDLYAGAMLLTHGYDLIYVPEAVVVHSHNFGARAFFRRYFDIGVFHAVHPWIQESFGPVAGEGVRFLRHEWQMLLSENRVYLFPASLFYTTVKWFGFQFGKRYRFLPMCLRRLFSANRNWWQRKEEGD